MPILKAEKFFPRIIKKETQIPKISKNDNNSVCNKNVRSSLISLCNNNDNKKSLYSSDQNLPVKCNSKTTISNKIPPMSIELDDMDMFRCEIVSVTNPSEFYIRPLNESNEEYLILEEKMMRFYESSQTKNKTIENAFAVRYKSNFHRAIEIKNDRNYYNEHLMYFIDKGLYKKVQNDDIYPLKEEFCKLPARVIRCSLCNILPNSSDKKWPQSAIDWFKCEIEIYDVFYASPFTQKNKVEM